MGAEAKRLSSSHNNQEHNEFLASKERTHLRDKRPWPHSTHHSNRVSSLVF